MVLLLIQTTVIYFPIFIYAASYLTDQMHFSSARALDVSTINLVVLAFLVLLIGYLSDRLGRRALFVFGAIGTLIFAIPLWWLMHRDSLGLVFAGQLGFSALNVIGWVLSITVLTEIAPPRLRCSAVALSYDLCMAAFGGTTPMVATYPVSRTGNDFTPAYCAMAATALSLVVILRLPKLIEAARREEARASLNSTREDATCVARLPLS
jgi:MFS transporter, MHS family, proline/betaine transporter